MSGVPVVLVHGLRSSRTMWRAQAEALRATGRDAVAIDLPGHGARRGERFTLAGAIDTVEDAVVELSSSAGRPALVVGLSLGGYLGIAHAARHPEHVAGLVAAACSTHPYRPVLQAWSMAARGIGRLPDAGAGLNQYLVDRVLPAAGAQDAAAGGFALDVVADVLRAMRDATPVADLRRIECPVWLVNGRYDHFRGEERRFLRACRDGRLVVVRGATHLVSLDEPTAFTRVLLEVLAELEGSSRAVLGTPRPMSPGAT